jgi:tetratricopeptide (TPR) repeat protein
MRFFKILFLLGLSACAAMGSLSLPEQLELARQDQNTTSQIEIIRRMISAGEGTDELRGRLVELWLSIQDFDMAGVALKEWKSAPPETVALTRAEILLKRDQNPEEAISILEYFLVKNPSSEEATRRLADVLWQESRSKRLVEFLTASPLISGDAQLMMRRAQGQRELGNFAAAIADMDSAIAMAPDNTAITNMAPSFERLKQALPAMQAAQATLATSPTDLGALVSMAFWKLYAGLPKSDSQSNAAAALSAHPDSMAAKIAVAVSSPLPKSEVLKTYLVNLDAPGLDPAQLTALVQLDDAVNTSPKKAEALVKRAYFLSDRPAQYELALADAAAALAIQPENSGALLEEIYSYSQLRRTNLAAASLQALEAFKPGANTLSTGYRYLADAEFAEGKYLTALGTVNRSIALAASVPAYKLRAAIYQRLGRETESRADLEKVAVMEKSRTR